MKKIILLMSVLVLTVGCNNTTTSSIGTTTSPRTGEPVRKKLTLTAAKEQAINRGATDTLNVSIGRTNFDAPVTLSVSELPKGVEVVEKDLVIATGSTSFNITLKAAADAVPGEYQVTLSASADGLDKTSQMFKLTVK